MLKIRYDKKTRLLSGWEDNLAQFDLLQPRKGEETIELDTLKPDSDDYENFKYDGVTLVPNPAYTPPLPPLCTHWAIIDSIDLALEKPVKVRRTWQGREYKVDCYVTENIKDQWQAGDIVVGDFVLVQFLDDMADRAVVFSKVLKTW